MSTTRRRNESGAEPRDGIDVPCFRCGAPEEMECAGPCAFPVVEYTPSHYHGAMPTSDDRVQIILPPDDLAMTDRLAQHLADQSGSAPNRSAAIRFAVRRTVEALGLSLVSTTRKKRPPAT